MTKLIQILATKDEQEIRWEPTERQEDLARKKEAYKNTYFHKFDNFMLKKPEPVRKEIEFGVYNMGKIKGKLI